MPYRRKSGSSIWMTALIGVSWRRAENSASRRASHMVDSDTLAETVSRFDVPQISAGAASTWTRAFPLPPSSYPGYSRCADWSATTARSACADRRGAPRAELSYAPGHRF